MKVNTFMVSIQMESEFREGDLTAPALKNAIEAALEDLCHTIRVPIWKRGKADVPDPTYNQLSDLFAGDEHDD